MMLRWLITLAAMAGAARAAESAVRSLPIRFETGEHTIRVLSGTHLVAVYHFGGPRSPSFHPVIGPTGTNVLREYPFAEVPGESRDHPHHRGIWLAHGDVNGHDFWSSPTGERIEQVAVLALDHLAGRLATSNHWIAAGQIIATDTRNWTISVGEDGSVAFDLEWRLYAPDHEVVLGDTKEGTLALRLATALQCDPPGGGTLVNSEGESGAAAWARRARWCRASGSHGGGVVSVLLYDHPSNPGHPNGWHVRTYGLLAANPFARAAFRWPDPSSPSRIAPQGFIAFRWRIAIVPGLPAPAAVDSAWRTWAAGGIPVTSRNRGAGVVLSLEHGVPS